MMYLAEDLGAAKNEKLTTFTVGIHEIDTVLALFRQEIHDGYGLYVQNLCGFLGRYAASGTMFVEADTFVPVAQGELVDAHILHAIAQQVRFQF